MQNRKTESEMSNNFLISSRCNSRLLENENSPGLPLYDLEINTPFHSFLGKRHANIMGGGDSTSNRMTANQFPASEEPLVLESLFALSPKSTNKSDNVNTPKKETK